MARNMLTVETRGRFPGMVVVVGALRVVIDSQGQLRALLDSQRSKGYYLRVSREVAEMCGYPCTDLAPLNIVVQAA